MAIAGGTRRLARIVGLFWGTSVAAEMEYRANFVLAALTSTADIAGSLFGLWLFYRTGYTFSGWSWEEALVVLGVFTILQSFVTCLLTPNLSRIVHHVREGTLDFVLLKPLDAQIWLSLRSVSPWGLPDLLIGAGIVAWAGGRAGAEPMGLLALLPALLFAALSLYGLWFALATTSVWFVKVYNITEVLRGLLDAGRFPAAAYPPAYRLFFTFVVPVVFLTTVPADALLGRGTAPWLLGSALLAALTLLGSRLFFRFALRHYTSASS